MRCKICQEEDCKKHSFLIFNSKSISEFSGSTPPEIFVGKWNYPNVYAGVLSPQEIGDTSLYSSPEKWHSSKLTIPEILSYRQKMIYSRKQTNIKQTEDKIINSVKEIAMSEKPISAEYKLATPIIKQDESDSL